MPHICQFYVMEASVQSSQKQNCSYFYLPLAPSISDKMCVCVCMCVFTATL